MESPKFNAEEKMKIGRAMHLRGVIDSPGWSYISQILQAIVNDRLAQLDSLNEPNEAKAATLAIEWKRSKAFVGTLLATIQDQIKEGEEIALSRISPQQIEQMPEAAAFPVVRPQCDMQPEPETQE